MDNGLHFISGLPRSGSTLLSAILRQNPRFHAGMSSPVSGLFQRMLAGMSAPGGFSVMISQPQREDLLRGIFDIYYKDIHPARTVFDTGRMWCSKMGAVARLYPDSKVIVCVRELAWIVDSFERILAKNPLIVSRMFKPQDSLTMHARVNSLASGQGSVGFAWNAVQEALHGEHAGRLIVVDYEALARDPKRAMEFVYKHLDMPAFEHDFNDVAFEASEEFDAQLGVPGLHTVAREVRFSQRATILPPDLFERFSGRNFWRWPTARLRDVPVLLPAAFKPVVMQQGGVRASMEAQFAPPGAL